MPVLKQCRTSAFALLVILVASTVSFGADHYVSPSATGSGNGTIGSPWTIFQMLAPPAAVQPGDTIYLRGGIYSMRGDLATYWCDVTGTLAAPVTIRNYPGERPAIDWDYIFAARGPYTHYIGIEWFGSLPQKILNGGWAQDRPPALSLYGDGVKFINNVIHDVSEFKVVDTAEGAEAYGNLMYYFGFNSADRSWGTTCYGQSQTGPVLLKDNIMMHQFANNLQLYGSDTAMLNNVTVEGNVIMHAGELGWTGGFNAIVWPGLTAENINFNNNFLYQPDPNEGTNLDLRGAQPSAGGGADPNTNLDITDNWIAGGAPAVRMGYWNPTDFRNNKVYGEYGIVWASKSASYTYNWNNNQYYYGPTPDEGWRTDVMFSLNGPFITSFAAWQTQTGLDAATTFANDFPTGVQVYVRANAYEQGRAHIIITNGDNANSTSVSLANTGLQNGQTYEIRDAQDFYGTPVLAGTYNSASPNVTLPLNLTTITKIVGWDYAPNFEGPYAINAPVHSDKRLNVFVVRTATPGTPQTPPTVSLVTPANSSTVSGPASVTSTAAATAPATVANVKYYLDNVLLGTGGSPTTYAYSWDTTLSNNGVRVLKAVVTDSTGLTAESSSFTITVNNTGSDTTPPTVSLSNLVTSDFITDQVTLQATAADNVGVTSVQFRHRPNGAGSYNNIGAADTTAPYEVVWDSTGRPSGSFEISAVATDAAANTTASAVATVTLTTPVGYATVVNDLLAGTGGSNLNSHTADSGHTWARHANAIYADGNFLLDSNLSHSANDTNRVLSLSSYVPPSDTYRVKINLLTILADGSQIGVVGQADPTTDTMIFLNYDGSTQNLVLWHRDNGPNTQLGSYITDFSTTGSSRDLILEFVGGAIHVYSQGIRRIVVADNPLAVSTTRRVGLRGPGTAMTASSGFHVDSFNVSLNSVPAATVCKWSTAIPCNP